jgi:hypothetical protein
LKFAIGERSSFLATALKIMSGSNFTDDVRLAAHYDNGKPADIAFPIGFSPFETRFKS